MKRTLHVHEMLRRDHVQWHKVKFHKILCITRIKKNYLFKKDKNNKLRIYILFE